MADQDLSTPLLLEEARASAVRLQEAWPWLADALEPGTVTVIERSQDMRNAEVDEAEYWRDQTARFWSVKAGIVPSGPHPSAIRTSVAGARRQIMATVRDVAEGLWTSVHPGTTLSLTVLAIDPTTRVMTRRCEGGCGGDGLLPRDEGDPKKPREICRRCDGRGHVPTGAACMACLTQETCRCDVADAIVAVGLLVILDLLRQVTDPDVAAEAQRELDRADGRARTIAGVGEDKRLIKAPCPACGRRGDLKAEISATKKDGTPDVSRWKIRCEHPSCICRGPGCSCGLLSRWPGRRHIWPSELWDGPNGLAARLGVELPGTERRVQPETGVAMAAAA